MQWVQNAITLIRNTRQESGLPAQKKVPAHLLVSDGAVRSVFESLKTGIHRLALLTELHIDDPAHFATPKYAATNASENFDLVIPLEGLISTWTPNENDCKKELKKFRKRQPGSANDWATKSLLPKHLPKSSHKPSSNTNNSRKSDRVWKRLWRDWLKQKKPAHFGGLLCVRHGGRS